MLLLAEARRLPLEFRGWSQLDHVRVSAEERHLPMQEKRELRYKFLFVVVAVPISCKHPKLTNAYDERLSHS